MPICKCALCGGPQSWKWEEAFWKDGFDNGVNTQTTAVVDVLANAGFKVELDDGFPNPFIKSIKTAEGVELIQDHICKGEEDPTAFLPDQIVRLLDDATFADDAPWGYTALIPGPFSVDSESSTDENLFVDIEGLCSISIKREAEGVVVDVYRLGGEGNAVATLFAMDEDLVDDDGSDDDTAPSPRIIAEFIPQVWENDVAVDIAAPFPNTWDVTDLITAMGEGPARALKDDQYETDVLRDADNAPNWVKVWPGPYYVRVEQSIANYYDAIHATPQMT